MPKEEGRRRMSNMRKIYMNNIFYKMPLTASTAAAAVLRE
jgi:hypothetical protein